MPEATLSFWRPNEFVVGIDNHDLRLDFPPHVHLVLVIPHDVGTLVIVCGPTELVFAIGSRRRRALRGRSHRVCLVDEIWTPSVQLLDPSPKLSV